MTSKCILQTTKELSSQRQNEIVDAVLFKNVCCVKLRFQLFISSVFKKRQNVAIGTKGTKQRIFMKVCISQ